MGEFKARDREGETTEKGLNLKKLKGTPQDEMIRNIEANLREYSVLSNHYEIVQRVHSQIRRFGVSVSFCLGFRSPRLFPQGTPPLDRSERALSQAGSLRGRIQRRLSTGHDALAPSS